MATIFISHSSLNKDVARHLAKDLTILGHAIWLDEWNIKVGQCIATEIERGIGNVEFVVLLLSKHAIKSNWVDREWKMAYWDEVKSNSIIILPALLEETRIPKLLQTKKYANFTQSYAIGFRELANAIDWYCEGGKLETPPEEKWREIYAKKKDELPTIIRTSKELEFYTCNQLVVKSSRLIGKLVGIKNAQAHDFFEPISGYFHFCLHDSYHFDFCLVAEGSPIEDIIIEQPRGNFYGEIHNDLFNYTSLLVSEFEPVD